ncbi:MAG: phospholipase D-like domain-containing protein, partial [Malacoplasma sp.]
LPNLPDDKNYILTINRSNYQKLLEANIEIYEYKGFMHSKIILIDADYSILGTNNLDFRSLLINFETAILVFSNKINKQLNLICSNYIKNSDFIKIEDMKLIFPKKEKIKMNLINIVHPLL